MDVFKPVVLIAATVLENGESAVAVRDTILSTINDSGEILAGLKETIERESPDYDHGIPEKHEMTIRKLVNGHTTTDTCKAAQNLNALIQVCVVDLAKK